MSAAREAIGQVEVVRCETPGLDGLPKRNTHVSDDGLISEELRDRQKDGRHAGSVYV